MEREEIAREKARLKELWTLCLESLGLNCVSLSDLKKVSEGLVTYANIPSREDLTEDHLSVLNDEYRIGEAELYSHWAYVYDQIVFLLSENVATKDEAGGGGEEESYCLKFLLAGDESLPQAATFLALSCAYLTDRHRKELPNRSDAKNELAELQRLHDGVVSALNHVHNVWDPKVEHGSLMLQVYRG